MKIIFYILFFTGLVASCKNLGERPEGAANQEITKEHLEQQLSKIEDFIAQGSCTGGDHCNFIPYGRKACGGPQGFLIFSSSIDTEKLREMVNSYTKAEITFNEQNQVMSDCSLPAEPLELGCENGNCVRIQ